jgi:ketosteroid isomerase-like protein
VAEWLRSGLQSRLHRFDSGRRLLRLHETLLRELYDAFNRRDIDAVLAALHPEVDWPNAFEGGRVHGHADVLAYWTRQFAQIDPRVEPLRIEATDDGRVAVAVHQVVRALDGGLLADREVTHVYTLRDGLIVRMDVIEPTE